MEKAKTFEKIDKLEPKDALPLLIRFRKAVLGKNKPDGFTRLVFFVTLFSWVFLAVWNAISYFVLLSADVIEQNKGLPVTDILIKNGEKLGFQGEEFIEAIHQFYLISNFVWGSILIGLLLLYRKKNIYTWIVLGAFAFHFSHLTFTLGFQYFWEDISFFDKILYSIIIVLVIIHSALMRKEKRSILLED